MKKTLMIVSLIVSLGAVAAGVASYVAASNSAQAQTQPVIAFVESDLIIQNYEPAKNLNLELDQLKQKSELDLEKTIKEKYGEGDVNALPEESRAAVQKMVEEADGQYQKEMERVRDEKWKPIVDKIKETISGVAQAHGAQLVLEKSAVIYGGIDISDEVIKKLSTP